MENLCSGPFIAFKKIGVSVYTLDIPDTWKRAGIHPSFDMKVLIPYLLGIVWFSHPVHKDVDLQVNDTISI